MRNFDQSERRQADLFYADLVGMRRPRRGPWIAAPEERSLTAATLDDGSIDAGRLFDGVVHRGMDPNALLVETDGRRWEIIALPRSATPRRALPDGALVVERALGEGRLACLKVLGDDIPVQDLYAHDGRIRADVLVLGLRDLPRPQPRWISEVAETGESDLSFLRWSPANRAMYFPPRDATAPGGRAFMETIKGEGAPGPADWVKREDAIVAQLVAGNMPDALLRWIKVDLTYKDSARSISGTIEVLPDYLAVGHNDDYVYAPLDPVSAQLVADRFDTILPTARICHGIYKQTAPKNRINAIERDYYKADSARKTSKPRRAQTSTASYLEHSDAIQAKMKSAGINLGELVGGHKKDVVIARRLHAEPDRIAFHGFYDSKEYPHEPCYENPEGVPKPSCNKEAPTLAHSRRFSDYSQGVRLINPWMIVNGDRKLVADVLADPDLSYLISSEGPIVPARIPKTAKPKLGPAESVEGEVAEAMPPTAPAIVEDNGVGEAVPLGGGGRFRHAALGGEPGDNVEARWNVDSATPSGSTIDIVVHLHGYGTPAADFLARKATLAGLEMIDSAGAVRVRASRRTLALVPRGRNPGGVQWVFDALPDRAAFDALVDAGLAWLCTTVLRLPTGSTLTRGRLTLMAHSGGGAGISALVAKGLNPDEVVCFDSMYGGEDSIRRWAEARIGSADAARSGLRVFYTGCSGPSPAYPSGRWVQQRNGSYEFEDPGSWTWRGGQWRLTTTEVSARRLQNALERALSKATGGAALANRFRVERTSIGHNHIPARYSPALLDDIAATVPNASAAPAATSRPACVANDDWLTGAPVKPGGNDPKPPRPTAASEAVTSDTEDLHAAHRTSEALGTRSPAGVLERPPSTRTIPEDFGEDVPAGLLTNHLWQEWHASQAPTTYAGPATDDRRVVEKTIASAAGPQLVAKARLHLCFLERAVATFTANVPAGDFWAQWEIVTPAGVVVREHPTFTALNAAGQNAAAKLTSGQFAWMWDGRNSASNPVFVAAGTYRSRVTVVDSTGTTRAFTTPIEVEGEPYTIFIAGQPKSDADLTAALASPPGGAAWAGRLLNSSGERIGNDCWLKVFRGQRNDGHTVFLGHGTIEATKADGTPKFGAIQTPHGVDFKGWIRRDPHGDMARADRVQIEDVGSTNERITLPSTAAAPVSNLFTDDPSHGAFKDGVQAHQGAVATTNGLSVGCTTACPVAGHTCASPGAQAGAVRSINSSFGGWGITGQDAALGGPPFVNKQNKRGVADARLADDHAAPLLTPAGAPACAGGFDEPLHMQPTAQQGVFGGFKGHEIPLSHTVADAPAHALRIRMQLESYPVGSKYHLYHHAVAFGHAFELNGRDLTVRVWIPRKVMRGWNGNRRNVLVRGNCRILWTLEHVPPGAAAGAARVVLHQFAGAVGGGFLDLPNGDIGKAERVFVLPDPPPARPLFSVFRYQLRLQPFVAAIDAWVAEGAHVDALSPHTANIAAETLSTTAAGQRIAEGSNELVIP